MKKLPILSLIVLLPFLVTGCASTQNKQVDQNQPSNDKPVQQNEKPTGNNVQKDTPDKNVFTSIKDAVSKQLGIKCEYSENGNNATVYIKGQNVYMESTVKIDDQTASYKGIMKDKTYYMWEEGKAQGIKFDLSKVPSSDEGTAQPTNNNVQTEDQLINKLEAQSSKCLPDPLITESKFDLPKSVTFSEFAF